MIGKETLFTLILEIKQREISKVLILNIVKNKEAKINLLDFDTSIESVMAHL
jgi:hypothetical protein